MKRTLIIGHRGTGKTSILKRIENYYQNSTTQVLTLDLDTEIVKKVGKKISAIFHEQGELHFRHLENSILHELIETYKNFDGDIYISLGAGFSGEIPRKWECLWVCRPTDFSGRVFLDRPRLDPNVSAIQEYQLRFQDRQKKYSSLADKILLLSEGFDFENEMERNFFLDKIDLGGSAVTLQFSKIPTSKDIYKKINYFLSLNVNFIELRDDLIDLYLCSNLEPAVLKKIIVSFRDPQKIEQTKIWTQKFKPFHIDWASELGPCPEDIEASILSFHTKIEPLSEFFKHVEKYNDNYLSEHKALFLKNKNPILKIAVQIQSFYELKIAHNWSQEDLSLRNFLPSSLSGRWYWYRHLMKNKLKINFVREDHGTSPDQPSFFEWQKKSHKHFAAVLGDPVSHSRTPAEQFNFFNDLDLSVYAIQISESDFVGDGLDFLRYLGLQAAAVTSPLKHAAYNVTQVHSQESELLKSVNTLAYKKNKWHGTNTDVFGLQKMFEHIEKQELLKLDSLLVYIWGGGGVLTSIKNILPHSIEFSARTGKPRSEFYLEKLKQTHSPDVLIWAIGRSSWEEAGEIFPSSNWRPQFVIDLNYSENSPGREFAQKINSKYYSGLLMFKYQALGQQQYWKTLFT